MAVCLFAYNTSARDCCNLECLITLVLSRIAPTNGPTAHWHLVHTQVGRTGVQDRRKFAEN